MPSGPLSTGSDKRGRRAMLALATGILATAHDLKAQDRPDLRQPMPADRENDILKSDYQQNLRDIRQLIGIARAFQREIEKDQQFVLSVTSLKRLDEIDKITRQLRARLKHS